MRQIVVRRYQLRKPVDWNRECDDQLYQQNRLWNALVAIDRQFRERYRQLLSENRAVAAAEAAMTLLLAEQRNLITERKRRRAAARSKSIDTSDIETRLTELRPLISAQAATAKAAKLAAKETITEQRKELSNEHFEAVKKTCQNAVADGLWWSNCNAVHKSYQTARVRAMKNGTDLNFHGYRGEGRLTNQIQGGMSPQVLFSERHSQVKVSPVDPAAFTSRFRGTREQYQNTTLEITALARGRDYRKNVRFPMQLSRPIPDDVNIKDVVVTRRKVGSHWRHAAVFLTTREVAELPPPDGPVVAIDLGWRRMTEGLRVATILGDGGEPSYVICPQRTLDDIERCEAYRRRRDELRNAILAYLTTIDWNEAPPELAELGKALRTTPASAFGRIARLALAWRDHRDWGDFARIEEWRRVDKRLWDTEANLRDKALYRRLDGYRKAAKAICEHAGVIILEKFNIADVAIKETKDGEETDQVRAMRRYRTIAAPSEFRKWILIQAEKRGIPIPRHQGVSNNPHHRCGVTHRMVDPTALRQYCPGCGEYYDIDVNACRNMLAAYHASGAEPSKTPPPLAAD